MAKKDLKKLRVWQERLKRNEAAYSGEFSRFETRKKLYDGVHDLKPVVRDGKVKTTAHVRNLCAELIESQVSSDIPQPKVTARRQKDEDLAKLIEDMLRNELDRLPFEELNDLLSRIVPIQGGAGLHIEWDNTLRTHTTTGELTVSSLHPRMILPQAGVYSGIEDMDYLILKFPQTRGYLKRRYGVDVSDERESEPELRGDEGQEAEDLVTQYVGYARNENGSIDRFSWVGDTVLEDLENYQARRLRRCSRCGQVEPGGLQALDTPTLDGTYPELAEPKPAERDVCPFCGASSWEESLEEFEELYRPLTLRDGTVIPEGEWVAVASEEPTEEADEYVQSSPSQKAILEAMELAAGGEPVTLEFRRTKIPYYKPDVYPVVIIKNVSADGKFLGDSDLDRVADQQNTTNRLSQKILDLSVQGGSYLSLPDSARIEASEEDMKIIRLGSPADLSMLGVYDMQGNISQVMGYLQQVYEEARQEIGITDSFQGRKDTTATSGTAKQFAAAQTAGRLESKRIMRNAAYARLFELMFKFKLTYADEPRPVVSENSQGQRVYDEFDRYDFLERDEAGEFYWNDQFLFSVDTSAPLAGNREAMWQETRLNFQSGAFGDPAQPQTLILFWRKMEQLHYPGAAETRAYLEDQLEQAQQARQVQQSGAIQAMQGQVEQAAAAGTGQPVMTAQQMV